MGACNSKKKIPNQQVDQTDILVDMRMTIKRFESQASQAEKQKNQELQKARKALSQNNEESARLYLQNAASKQATSQQALKMANKMDALTFVIKNSSNTQEMTGIINKLTPLLQAQSQEFNPEQLKASVDEFEKNMDTLNIQGQLISGAMNNNLQDLSNEQGINSMLMNMKQEMYNEVNFDLNTKNQQLMDDLQNPFKEEGQEIKINK